MLLKDLFESDDHWKALRDTGFWGKSAAGCIFLAKDTKRFLIAHRSSRVEQPNTWGSWGGAIDEGETPEEAVRREIHEEAGYIGQYNLYPLYVFQKGSFKYHNFLAVVENEFTPELDWETQGFKWCDFGRWPEPLHFGLQALFSDRKSFDFIQTFLKTLLNK